MQNSENCAVRHRIKKPKINGKDASWEEALDRAADILTKAKRPFFFIGSETSTQAMGVGIEIAEHLGGLVDGNATICHGPRLWPYKMLDKCNALSESAEIALT